MPHGRGQVQYVELGLKRDGTIIGHAVPRGRRRRRVRRVRRHARDRLRPARWRRACTASRRSASTCAVALTNTTPMGAYRGAGRPEAAAMLERILDMAADELDIDPVELRRRNFIQPDEFPYTTVTGVTYDIGDYDAALAEALRIAGYDDAARRAGGAARARRREAARHRRRASTSRSPAAAGGEYSEVEVHDDGTRHAQGGHVGARPGSRDRVLADRVRASSASRSSRSASCSPTPRSCRAAAAPAARGRCSSAGARCSRRRELMLERAEDARRRAARGRARRHRRRGRRPLGVAGVPAKALTWAELAAGAERRASRSSSSTTSSSPGSTFPFGAHVVGRRGRHRDRPGRCRCATSRSTTAAASSTRCSSTVRCTAGSRRASRRRCGSRCVYDDDGNPLTSTLADYAHPERGRVPVVRGRAHRDAVAAQPARREGHRRVGHGRVARPRCRTRSSTRSSHLGVRHVDMPLHARARVARDRGRPAPAPCPTRGASPRPRSRRSRVRPQRRRRPRTRRSTSRPTPLPRTGVGRGAFSASVDAGSGCAAHGSTGTIRNP